MMDKSVPHGKVIMIKHDMDTYPRYSFPEGFYITGYRKGFEKEWAAIELEQQELGSLERAEEIFRNEFILHPEWLAERCLFIVDKYNDKVAAVISLWMGTLVDEPHNRVHWIATREAYQGLGLIKAAFTYIMDLYHKLGGKGYTYLTTQTWSYKAVNIYQKFGFVPYMGELHPKNADFDYGKHAAAWRIIDENLAQYKRKT